MTIYTKKTYGLMRTIYRPFLWLLVLIMVWVVPAQTMADEANPNIWLEVNEGIVLVRRQGYARATARGLHPPAPPECRHISHAQTLVKGERLLPR